MNRSDHEETDQHGQSDNNDHLVIIWKLDLMWYHGERINGIEHIAERCSRTIAKPPSKSAVKAWFCNLTNSLQQIINDEGGFPSLFPGRILTFVSNCRNLRSASPSFSKNDRTHTAKSVLRLVKRPNDFTPRISTHEIHISHTKTQHNDSGIIS